LDIELPEVKISGRGHKASETDCSGRVKHKQRGWMKCERIYLNLSTEITFKHFMLQL